MKKILVVDDENFFIQVLTNILEEAGYEVLSANNGQRALDIIKKNKPDLVLLDVLMPGMDGYETCKNIKQQTAWVEIPVIFLTVKSNVKDEAMGFDVGAVDYITKPVSPPIVLARIKTHLELKSAKDKLQHNIFILEDTVQKRTRDLISEIDERKEIGHALRIQEIEVNEILDNLPVGVLITNDQGIIIRANLTASTIFAYTKESLIGKNINMLFSSPGSPGESLNGETKQVGLGFFDLIGKRNNDELFPVRLSLVKKNTQHNGLQGLIYSFLDITEQKQHEEQLVRLQKLNALGIFIGGIVHDYNNMLLLISGYSEILHGKLSKTDNSDLLRYIDKISQAVDRGSALNNKLLSYSKITPTKVSVVNLSKIIDELRFMLEKVITKTINVEFILAKKLWDSNINQGDFEDAVINLCSNAVYAMPDGGTLTIKTENCHLLETDAKSLSLPAGNYIKVLFRDTGQGMDQKTQDKIFDPFFSTKGDSGTGLGLSQLYSFIKRSSAAVKVHSELGFGTTFELFFPKSLSMLKNKKELQSTDNDFIINIG